MRRWSAILAVLALLLSACAIPAERDNPKPAKRAAEQADVEATSRYRAVRNAAIGLLDPKPLSTVESGPMLAIDTGSFEVSQRLSTTQDEVVGPAGGHRRADAVVLEVPAVVHGHGVRPGRQGEPGPDLPA